MRRFAQEVKSAALLDHAHVLPVYEVGRTSDAPFFTMKYAGGGSLADQACAERGDRFNWMADVLAKVADAVQFAHEHGVLHRDLKPANILFDEAGEPYVADFGLAKWLEGSALGETQNLTRTITALGTPHYLAPEIASGKTTAASTSADVYALGAILYEMLCGRPPHEGESITLVLRHVADKSPDAPSKVTSEPLPKDLEAVCLKAMQREPQDRYTSAALLAADLRRFLSGEGVLARPLPWPSRCLRWMRRYPKAALVIAGAVTALVSSIVMLIHGHNVARTGLAAAQLSEARLLRQSMQYDRRATALAQIELAASAAPSEALRDEAAAVLAIPDWSPATHYSLPKITAFPVFNGAVDQALNAETDRVTLRQLATNEVLWSHPVPVGVRCVALQMSASERLAALCFDNGKAEVWDTGANELLLAFEPFSSSAFHLHPLKKGIVWINKAGEFEFQSLLDKEIHLTLPYVKDGKPEAILRMTMNPIGNIAAVLHKDGVDVISRVTRKLLWSVPVLDAQSALCFSGDSLKLVVVSRRSIVVLDAKTGALLSRLSGHQRGVTSVASMPGTEVLLSASMDGSIRAWDTDLYTPLWELQCSTSQLHTTSDGLGFVTTSLDRGIEVWRQTPSTVFRKFTDGDADPFDYIFRFTASPGGELFVTTSKNHARLWDAETRKMAADVTIKGKDDSPPIASFSADDKALYLARVDGLITKRGITRSKGQITLGKPETLHPASANVLLKITPPPASDWIIWRDELRVWPGGDAAREHPLVIDRTMRDGHIDPSVRWVTTSNGKAGEHSVYPVGGTGTAFTFTAESDSKVRWTRDYLAVTGHARVRLFRTGSWEQALEWPSRSDFYVGGWIATGAGGTLAAIQQERDVIELVDVPHQRLLVRLEPPAGIEIQGMAFSSNGDRLFLGGMGHRIYEWDLKALNEELAKLGLGVVKATL